MSARTKLTMIAVLGLGIAIGAAIPRETKTLAPPTAAPPQQPQPAPAAVTGGEPALATRARPPSSRPEPIAVPSDPRATYQLLEWRRMPNGHREAMTRRDGPSGITFARREIDCEGMRFRYLGEGDTVEEARLHSASPEMGDLTPESISTYVSRFVCAK
jgi:hypothetical protein